MVWLNNTEQVTVVFTEVRKLNTVVTPYLIKNKKLHPLRHNLYYMNYL